MRAEFTDKAIETEVAVDSEMLGKVFENLLPENPRHKGGTYYTPRVIVNYMCQQSLINYLAAHLEADRYSTGSGSDRVLPVSPIANNPVATAPGTVPASNVPADIENGAALGHPVSQPDCVTVLPLQAPLMPFASIALDDGEAAMIQLALEQQRHLECRLADCRFVGIAGKSKN